MKNIDAEFELQACTMIDYLSSVTDAKTRKDFADLHHKLLCAITAQMEVIYQKLDIQPTDFIEADESILLVRTQDRVYTRNLPMNYSENSNGITIKGENFEGTPSSITFLSREAVEKMKELMGDGLTEPRCDNH